MNVFNDTKVGKVCPAKVAGVFLLSPRWDPHQLQGYPRVVQHKNTFIHWVERDTVRLKCLAQGHQAMILAKAQTWMT